ncbi:acetyl-CoA carboxylase biotin carboxyl carrier protein [Ahrensia sp. R2A130]|uniref:acetyl-CoA carboxylase biotin carboxyl carrier protein n=1 Tax=Ahrensia sp. R2A130 TaxID=744979 RepID=UPI0001E0D093|nr:acetyl-CoA carboxylase biotin carboxyl carrier protein [Ahrensia sp. R2A130]EFL90274.1 acetyl-CoA carboxylase, biotin carboxyl carrier protein [Ahrensia sp. R2A130]
MSASKNAKTAIDTKLIRELAEMLTDTDLNEIEVGLGEFHVRLARGAVAVAAPMQVQPAAAAPAPVAAASPAAAVPAEAPAGAGEPVPSPMVGTAYLSPAPGADVFVKVGDKIKKGDTILIVEAMKTMNQIASPRDGTVESINVVDGQPVEFGEALVMLS